MQSKGVLWRLPLLVIGLFITGRLETVDAGMFKVHEWPVVTQTYIVPQEICNLDILIGVGYYISLSNQDAIVVGPDYSTSSPWSNYAGYIQFDAVTNFPSFLSVSIDIEIEGPGIGQWTASVSPEFISVGSTSVKIFVEGKDVDILGFEQEGRICIGKVTLSVVPW